MKIIIRLLLLSLFLPCTFHFMYGAPLDGRFYGFSLYGMAWDLPTSYNQLRSIDGFYYALHENTLVKLSPRFDSLAIDSNILGKYSCINDLELDNDSNLVVCNSGVVATKLGNDWKTYTACLSIPTDQIYGIAKTKAGRILFTSRHGIIEFSNGQFTLDTVSFDVSKGEFDLFPRADFSIGVVDDTIFYPSLNNSIVKYCNGVIKDTIKFEYFYDNDFLYAGKFKKVDNSLYFQLAHRADKLFKIMKYDGGIKEILDLVKSKCPLSDSLDFRLESYCVDRKERVWVGVSFQLPNNYRYFHVYVWNGSKWLDPEIIKNVKINWINNLQCIGDKVFIMTANNKLNQMFVYDDDPTSVRDDFVRRDISISPNPTTGPATLTLNSGRSGQCTVRAVDVTGREVMLWQGKLPEGRNVVYLDMSGIAAGCNNIIVEQEGFLMHVKVMKE